MGPPGHPFAETFPAEGQEVSSRNSGGFSHDVSEKEVDGSLKASESIARERTKLGSFSRHSLESLV